LITRIGYLLTSSTGAKLTTDTERTVPSGERMRIHTQHADRRVTACAIWLGTVTNGAGKRVTVSTHLPGRWRSSSGGKPDGGSMHLKRVVEFVQIGGEPTLSKGSPTHF